MKEPSIYGIFSFGFSDLSFSCVYLFVLEINILFSQGLESVFQEAIHASGAGKQEKRKQKGNVRNKMSRKKNSCMLL